MPDFGGYVLKKTDGGIEDLPKDNNTLSNYRVVANANSGGTPATVELFRITIPANSTVNITILNFVATDPAITGAFCGNSFNSYVNRGGGAVRDGSANGSTVSNNSYGAPRPSIAWAVSGNDAVINFTGKAGLNITMYADIEVSIYTP